MSHDNDHDHVPYLSQANTLGQGFDVYGVYGAESLLRPIFDLDIAPLNTFTFLGKEYAVPSIVRGTENTSSVLNYGSFVSREGFQSKIASFAGVEAKYGAFGGQLRAAYASEYARSTEYYYAFKNFYARLGTLYLNPERVFLSAEFTAAVERLPDAVTDENLPVFAAFFARFGAYFTSQVQLGASLEFYNGVSKTTTDNVTEIAAMLEAHYNALFSTGKVNAAIAATEEWKSYTENSSVTMAITGGDPAAAAHVQAIDAKSPSEASVSAYQAWLETISAYPAVSEFRLSGVWTVCGDKANVVQQAWQLYGSAMHPRLTVETSSPATQPPTITLGYQIKPTTPPEALSGWQIAIVDRRDVRSPSKVVFNRYYTFDRPWPVSYQKIYQMMARDIRESGYANEDHILIACGFGLDMDCSPPSDFYGLLRSAGGGQQLQQWVQESNPGSDSHDNACYVLVGVFNEGADTGLETYRHGWRSYLNVTLDAYFYRLAYGLPYTFGLGGLPAVECEPVHLRSIDPADSLAA